MPAAASSDTTSLSARRRSSASAHCASTNAPVIRTEDGAFLSRTALRAATQAACRSPKSARRTASWALSRAPFPAVSPDKERCTSQAGTRQAASSNAAPCFASQDARGARDASKRTKSQARSCSPRIASASPKRTTSVLASENNDRSANAPSLRANAPARASTSNGAASNRPLRESMPR